MRLIALELQDFQVHKEVDVPLSPTITTVVGPTDSGKSALLRALRWACLNDMAGEEFIREGADKTEVVLRVQEDKQEHVIRRVRGSRANTYELDETEFKAFGQSAVPQDIARLLQLNEINFQGQHDSPFWFSETAGEVSRRLNAVVDLSVIDTTLSNIASEVRRAQEKKMFVEERLKEAKLELEKLEPQRTRIEEFEALKDRHEKLSKVAEDCRRLASLIDRVRRGREASKQLEEKAEDGKEILALAREARGNSVDWTSLNELLSDINHYQQESRPPPDFGVVESCFDQWRNLDARANNLNRFLRSLAQATAQADEWKEKLRLMDKRFHEQTKGSRCPLCGKTLG